MRDANVLKHLIYCHKCYKNQTERKYIGECMHIVCNDCFKTSNKCIVCLSTSNFILLDDNFQKKLLRNPTESFQEPLESMMFQLSSALNLIMYQQSEISKLTKYVKRAKEEIQKIKMYRKPENNQKSSLFNFQKKENTNEKNNIKERIDDIYHGKNRNSGNKNKPPFNITNFNNIETNQQNKPKNTKSNYIMELTSANRKKYYTDFNPCDRTLSSSHSTRITLPPKNSEFKYVYRKQNRF